MMLVVSALVSLVLILTLPYNIAEAGKQAFKSDTSFNEDDNSLEQGKMERGNRAQSRINLTFPGTKWCGPGNTAGELEKQIST